MKNLAQSALRRFGYDLKRAEPNLLDFLNTSNVDCVFDVGANAGQFGRRLRDRGYKGRITSFEPVASAFAQLQHEARGDKLWELHHTALGDHCGKAEIMSVATLPIARFLARAT